MNKERLKIASEYLANKVKPKKFDMGLLRFDMQEYRAGDKTTPECKTVGCALGHLTALDDKFKTDPNYFRYSDGEIKFYDWAMPYFELSRLEYFFIFSCYFSYDFPKYTGKKQLAHIVERIDYLRIHGKVPDGFKTIDDCKKFGLGFSKGKRK